MKYTTSQDVQTAENPRGLQQSAALAFNSQFSLNGFERNFFFENRGDHFEELGAVSGIDSDIDARSFGVGDMDRDGDLDLVVKNLQRKLLQLYLNEMESDGHRIFVKLVGTDSNRDGIGARLELTDSSGRYQMAEMKSANGFQSQSPNEVFFGTADADQIAKLEITWPSGKTQSFENLASDTFFTVHEADGITERKPLERGATSTDLSADSRASVPKQTFFARKRPLPKGFNAKDLDGSPIAESEFAKGPSIVSFVQTWIPFLDEHVAVLERLRREHPDLQILLLYVDPVDDAIARKAQRSGIRTGSVPYGVGAGYAGQTNILFPSTFVVQDSEIRFDMIGRLIEEEALSAVTEALR